MDVHENVFFHAICKVVIYKYVFCLLLFRAKFDCNFIQSFVPCIVVGIYCKGCVIVRESVKTQAIEARKAFVGISRLSIPRKDACALNMTGIRRVCTDGDSCVS